MQHWASFAATVFIVVAILALFLPRRHVLQLCAAALAGIVAFVLVEWLVSPAQRLFLRHIGAGPIRRVSDPRLRVAQEGMAVGTYAVPRSGDLASAGTLLDRGMEQPRADTVRLPILLCRADRDPGHDRRRGRGMVETIKDLIPPHLFQAAAGEVISYFVSSKIHAAPPTIRGNQGQR